MIDWIKKHRVLFSLICVVILLLLIGIPFVINILFKINATTDIFVAEWSAGDALGYYGAILSFFGTVVLGALALYQNHIIKTEADKNAALVELKKIWSLSTEERYVLMYDQQMSRILREKGLLTAYDLCKSLGIDTDVYSMLQDAIWKRYKKIVKIVNDEVKAMAKGAK